MKILKKDLRNGEVKVMLENLDDLWYLSQVIAPGDRVKGRTVRRVKGKDDKVKADSGKRESIMLLIRAEKCELDRNTGHLRVLGSILEGPEDLVSRGDHHSFDLDAGSQISVTKQRWQGYELDYLREAEKAAKRAKVLVLAVDTRDSVCALVRDSGINYMEIRGIGGGKDYIRGREDKKEEYYTKLVSILEHSVSKENIDKIVICGTGFEKANFFDYLKEKNKELAEKSLVIDTGSDGRNAVNEVMKRGALEKATEEARIAIEAKLVERLLEEIAKSNLATYGSKQVENALNLGAVETLLVTDKTLLGKRSLVERMIKNARSSRAEFHIVNSDYEAGKKLDSLGGLGAILRYKVD